MTTLEHVAMQARPYPAHLLDGCRTGLILFAAAFNGWNDAIHYAEAGLRTTCVDIDREAVDRMRGIYPDEWRFTVDDAWEFAEDARTLDDKWDAVSCDTFTGQAMRRSLDSLELWCSIARRLVTVTWTDGAAYTVPDGWHASTHPRSGHVHWLVLTREP